MWCPHLCTPTFAPPCSHGSVVGGRGPQHPTAVPSPGSGPWLWSASTNWLHLQCETWRNRCGKTVKMSPGALKVTGSVPKTWNGWPMNLEKMEEEIVRAFQFILTSSAFSSKAVWVSVSHAYHSHSLQTPCPRLCWKGETQHLGLRPPT